jgi:hypothetical protein
MRCGEEPTVDDAIREISGLLAAAYKRHSGIRLVPTAPERLRSTGELAISGTPSVHELTLTRRRKESTQNNEETH